MVTKYIIEMDHQPAIGALIAYYYEGQNRNGESCFHTNQQKAKRYSLEHEAQRDMSILKVMHPYADSFKLVPIRCRA